MTVSEVCPKRPVAQSDRHCGGVQASKTLFIQVDCAIMSR